MHRVRTWIENQCQPAVWINLAELVVNSVPNKNRRGLVTDDS